MRAFSLAITGVAAMACSVSASAAAGYRIDLLGNSPKYTWVSAFDINNRGEIVGSLRTEADGKTHGFVYRDGAFSLIDEPGATFTHANGINDSGRIVGNSDTTSDGFSYFNGAFTRVEIPGSNSSSPYGLNNNGAVVGSYWTDFTPNDPDTEYALGYVYSNGQYSTIDPYVIDTLAYGINDQGTVVGSFVDMGDGNPRWYLTHGFTFSNGVFSAFDVPNAVDTELFGVSDRGELVGNYTGQDGRQHGFVSLDGTLTTLDVPGAHDTFIYGVNNAGQVVGSYNTNAEGAVRAFVATPTAVPELQTWAFCLAGLASVLVVSRRRAA